MDSARTREAIVDQARQLAVDALYSEKGHFAAAADWRTRHLLLGVPSALLAAFAGASALAETCPPWVTAAGAFISAALTGLTTFLKPEDRANGHHRAGTAYGALRRELRGFVQVKCIDPNSDLHALSDDLQTLTSQTNELQRSAPPIPGAAYGKAKKSIDAGSANYTEDELDAATGQRPTVSV